MKSVIYVRVRPYSELKNCGWFAEEMKRFCGNEYRVKYEVDRWNGKFYVLDGCDDWEFRIGGLEIL